MAETVKVVDTWVNPNDAVTGEQRVGYLFPGFTERAAKGETIEETIALMEQSGIDKGLITYGYGDRDTAARMALYAVEKYPERFGLSVVLDPRKGMEPVRDLQRFARDYPCRAARLIAFKTQIPYDHPWCYPIYTTCIELDIPVCVNVGIPGPRVPGKSQDPMALDELCWFLPELKIVMAHGGDPWAALCVKLMVKWPNLYYQTSAFAPKYYPPEIVHFANTRGSDRIMFATGYPLLGFDRCVKELAAVPFRDDVRPKFLRENALRVFKL